MLTRLTPSLASCATSLTRLVRNLRLVRAGLAARTVPQMMGRFENGEFRMEEEAPGPSGEVGYDCGYG